MKIKDNIESNQYRKETILVTDCFYTISDEGKGERPLVHVCGRTWAGERRHVVIDGYRPYFYISWSEYENKHDEIMKRIDQRNSRIIGVDDDVDDLGMETGGHTEIVMIVCQCPYDVPDIRDWFDQTWEADVVFDQRFLIDMDITGGCTIPASATSDDPITTDEINPVDEVDIEPSMLTFDIEVHIGEQGFPDHENPDQLVTAITGHDSGSDTYWTGILEHSKWGDDPQALRAVNNAYDNYDFEALDDVDGEVIIYDRDDRLIYEFIEWCIDVDPDIISAWNTEFDIPYVVNRALRVGCDNLKRLSPVGKIDEVENKQCDTERAIKGRQIVDAMDMYEKTQIHESKSNALDAVAQKELGVGKEEIVGTDHAWVHEPETFVQYSIRDVHAVVEILQ